MTVLKPQPTTIPLPTPTSISAPYWEGCQRGELMVQRCQDCGHYVFIPQAACTECFSDRLEWVKSSGRGVVYSYSVVHRPQQPAFEIPYVVAIVEMEEGWYTLTNLVECEPDEVAIGMPVEVHFEPMSETVTLPLFKPA